MASTPESKVKAKIKKLLDEFNVWYAMPIGSGYGNSGVPDFLCCANGRFLAIEAKAPGGETTALQKRALTRIQEGQGVALVIREEDLVFLRRTLEALCATTTRATTSPNYPTHPTSG